jgi:hypothetical protein
MEIVAKLADRAFAHALTSANPLITTIATKGIISPRTATGLTTPEAPEPITSYIAHPRQILWGSNRYRGFTEVYNGLQSIPSLR